MASGIRKKKFMLKNIGDVNWIGILCALCKQEVGVCRRSLWEHKKNKYDRVVASVGSHVEYTPPESEWAPGNQSTVSK